jgi:hypothetical protein
MHLFPVFARSPLGLMRRRPPRSYVPIAILIAVLAFAWYSPAAAEDKAQREYAVADHGVLEFSAPKSWKMAIRPPQKDVPATIVLSPDAGNAFLLMITPMWSPTGDKSFNTQDKMKQLMEAERKHLAPSAEEPTLMVDSFGGPQAKGFYLFATDKAPRPGEFKYLIRSCVAVGDLMLSVTFLSNEKESAAMEDALALLRGVKVRPQ